MGILSWLSMGNEKKKGRKQPARLSAPPASARGGRTVDMALPSVPAVAATRPSAGHKGRREAADEAVARMGGAQAAAEVIRSLLAEDKLNERARKAQERAARNETYTS